MCYTTRRHRLWILSSNKFTSYSLMHKTSLKQSRRSSDRQRQRKYDLNHQLFFWGGGVGESENHRQEFLSGNRHAHTQHKISFSAISTNTEPNPFRSRSILTAGRGGGGVSGDRGRGGGGCGEWSVTDDVGLAKSVYSKTGRPPKPSGKVDTSSPIKMRRKKKQERWCRREVVSRLVTFHLSH